MKSATCNTLVFISLLQSIVWPVWGTSVPGCHGLKDGFYADAYDCRIFYRCVGSIPYQFSCPPGIYFDSGLNVCNWPHEVQNCDEKGRRIRHEPSNKPSLPDAHYNNNDNNNKNDGGWSFHGDDGAFPESRHFESFVPEPEKGQDPQYPGANEGNPEFFCPEKNGFYPHQYNCKLFFRCIAGRPFEFECARGTFFDHSIRVCNYPGRLPECDTNGRRRFGGVGSRQKEGDPGPSRSSSIEKPSKDIYGCPKKYGLFPHPKACTKFIYCNEYKGMLFECPKGLTFNYNKQICDFNKDFKC